MKKTTFVLLLAFLSFASTAQTIQQVVQNHFAALNKHDPELLATDYSTAVQFYSVSWEGLKTGIPEVKLAYSRYWKTSPDLVYKINNIFFGDNTATIEYETTGTMTNLEGGSPAYMQDRKYTLKNITVIRVINGKIIYDSTYFDQVSFLRQMDFFNQK